MAKALLSLPRTTSRSQKSVLLVPRRAEDQKNPSQRNELKKRGMTFSSSQMTTYSTRKEREQKKGGQQKNGRREAGGEQRRKRRAEAEEGGDRGGRGRPGKEKAEGQGAEVLKQQAGGVERLYVI